MEIGHSRTAVLLRMVTIADLGIALFGQKIFEKPV